MDAEVRKLMTGTHANGIAVAVIDHRKVVYVQSYGIRNAKGDPLLTSTHMSGTSLTKTVFAYTVMQLVDQGTPARSRCAPPASNPWQPSATTNHPQASAVSASHAAEPHAIAANPRSAPVACHPGRTAGSKPSCPESQQLWKARQHRAAVSKVRCPFLNSGCRKCFCCRPKM